MESDDSDAESSDSEGASDESTSETDEQGVVSVPSTSTARGRGRRLPTTQPPQDSFVAKDLSVWYKEPPPAHRIPAHNILTEAGGVNHVAADISLSAAEIFGMMFTSELVDMVLDYTNGFAQKYTLDKKIINPHYADWINLTADEFHAFVGILLYLGANRQNFHPIHAIWQKNEKYVTTPVIATMSRERFKSIVRFLRFDNRVARHNAAAAGILPDKTAYISEVFKPLVDNMQALFSPYETLTVDEMLVRFRGKAQFRVYMKSKPGRYGLKVWMVVDAASKYILKMDLYEGKKEVVEKELGKKVVLNLVQKYYGSGRAVTMDNFFTTKSLALVLMDHRLTLLGTLNKSRKDVIPALVEHRKKPVFSSMFAFQDNLTMVSYVPKKNRTVLLLSSAHHNKEVEPALKNKPTMILEYNRTKGGVDTADQMIATYTCQRATQRWPLKLFYALVDAAALNSYILGNANRAAPGYRMPDRRLFLVGLAESLMQPLLMSRSQLLTSRHLSLHLKKAMRLMGAPVPTDPAPLIDIQRARCNFCAGQRRLTRNVCQGCGKRVCNDHLTWICRCHKCEFIHVVFQ